MEPLVTLEQISKAYPVKDRNGKKGKTVALNAINLTIFAGETLGLVGESGSGKSTLGKILLGFEEPSAGNIVHHKKDYSRQIIFQDPYSSLNPRMSALELVMEPLIALKNTKDVEKQASEMLNKVGIVGEDMHKLPQQFSGGQRQRIGIARAVVSSPDFIVCDEPTSALDVSIQAQIINVLNQLKKGSNLSYLFISHNLAVVEHISDRIAVLYQGHLVELASTEQLFTNPQHAYTKKLLQASLHIDPSRAKQQVLMAEKAQRHPITLSPTFEWVEVEARHWVRKDTE